MDYAGKPDSPKKSSSNLDDPLEEGDEKLLSPKKQRICTAASTSAATSSHSLPCPPVSGIENENTVLLEATENSESAFTVEEVAAALRSLQDMLGHTGWMSYYELGLQNKGSAVVLWGKTLRLPVEEALCDPRLRIFTGRFIKIRLSEAGIHEPKRNMYAEACTKLIFRYLHGQIEDDQMKAHTLYSLAYLLCDDSLAKYLETYRDPKPIGATYAAFIDALEGNEIKLQMADTWYPNYDIIRDCFKDLRAILVQRKYNMSNFIDGVKIVLKGLEMQFELRKEKRKLSVAEYMKFKELTTGVDSFCRLCYLCNDLNFESFRDVSEYKELEDCARKISRIAYDIPAFHSDSYEHVDNNNFVLVKQKEANLLVNQALSFVLNYQNKLILKMICIKHKLEQDENLLNRIPHLLPAVKILFEFAEGVMEFGYFSSRYNVRTSICALRLPVDAEQVDIRLGRFLAQSV